MTEMKYYSPTGRRNHGRPLKRLLDTWDRNGSTCGQTPWNIYDDDMINDREVLLDFICCLNSPWASHKYFLKHYLKFWHFPSERFARPLWNQNSSESHKIYMYNIVTQQQKKVINPKMAHGRAETCHWEKLCKNILIVKTLNNLCLTIFYLYRV